MHWLESLRIDWTRDVSAKRVIAAVSGGADSVALLRALCLVHGAEQLTVAHLNHQLRGERSFADATFVRELCANLNVPCHVHCLDIAALVHASGGNLEAVARQQRYLWFGELALELGADTVVTGHTADDQAETVLLRLLRGTGLRGLRGIAVQRPLRAGVRLLRPLLGVTRADIRSFLQELGQPFQEDESNLDTHFARNRVRHQLLPILQEESPAIARHLSQVAEQATCAFAVIEQQAGVVLTAAELPRAGTVCIFRCETLATSTAYLTCEALRLLWQRERWPMDAMRQLDWERAAAAASGHAPAVDLPGPVRVRPAGHVVQIGPPSAMGR